jgi:hypothetical protein
MKLLDAFKMMRFVDGDISKVAWIYLGVPKLFYLFKVIHATPR